MPLYEYLCDACGHRFEKIQKFSDPLIEECPNCGEKKVHKLVSSPAIQFKGTGWYITDYAKKNTVDASSGSDAKDAGKSGDKKSADAKAGDSKTSSESKTSESKSSETKSSDSKSSDTKSTPSTSS